MKSRIVLLLSIICIVSSINAQNYQTVEEVNNACSQLGFSGDEDAEIAVDRILDQIGLFRNFTIQECPNINNAVAKNIEISPGHKERYILYDASFFKNMDDKTNSDWAAISILAHEIGHHLNGHALNDKGSNLKWELEADYFSGISMAKLGATLEEAQSAIQTLRYEKATSTHPAKADRLNEIERGWNKAKGKTTTKTTEEDNKEKAFNLYRKGEQAFQDYNFTEAITYFNKAKDLGNRDAYYYLSRIYFSGYGVTKDYKKVYVLAKKGYDLGSIPSTYQLGLCFSRGIGVSVNNEQANRLYQKNFQGKWFKDQYQENKMPFHASTIAEMYFGGYGGLIEDMEKAFVWTSKAAKQGFIKAQYDLGYIYMKGMGVEQNMNSAVYWYQKAVEKSYEEAPYDIIYIVEAQYELGYMYKNGFGVEKSMSKSIYWYRKAAKKGHIYAKERLTEIGETW